MMRALLLVALLCSCASTPRAAATQQAAIGGGLVAVGAASAVGDVYLFAVASDLESKTPIDLTPDGPRPLDAATPSLIIASTIAIVGIGVGAFLLVLSGAQLDEEEAIEKANARRLRKLTSTTASP